jgi:hypothetical protein
MDPNFEYAPTIAEAGASFSPFTGSFSFRLLLFQIDYLNYFQSRRAGEKSRNSTL